ncbi:MAG: glycoside hydrolase family 127 protein [Defluviitaleaceae bacterium]|nr:glycoside hydrolase family 127 protein [Defluviitaleaceae bacterium]
MNKTTFVSWENVLVNNHFWKTKKNINENVTLPAIHQQMDETGRIESVKLLYNPEKDDSAGKGEFTIDGVLAINIADGTNIPRPHHYWDSDLAKWIEATSYFLRFKRNLSIENVIDEIVSDYEAMQFSDGYLNTYYTVVEPGKRWTNVYHMHELYCAGHLIEGAMAYFQATGKKKFLDIVLKYVNHIDEVFGEEEGKIKGYPGHQQIEMALMKLYKLTNDEKHLRLAKFFIDERGKQPLFFDEEAKKHNRDVNDGGPKGILGRNYLSAGPYALFQSHLPVREQKEPIGHAVRVTYMASAMADIVWETDEAELWNATEKLWNSTTEKYMYITGGVGSQEGSERFSFEYQLPNEEAYQETCASIGMVMWGARMLSVVPNRKYGDVMERALYNSVLSGVSLLGDTFFYANHLSAHPNVYKDGVMRNPRMLPHRQKWFAVSCCPMNLARLIESVGAYIYSENEQYFYVHLFIDSSTIINKNDKKVLVSQQTKYPWVNSTEIEIVAEEETEFTLAVRNPEHCEISNIVIDGVKAEYQEKQGYIYIKKVWKGKELITVTFDMTPQFIESHPSVRMNTGKVAIQAGPVVYCLEEADNGTDLSGIFVEPTAEMKVSFEEGLLGGVNVIELSAKKLSKKNWDKLYKPAKREFENIKLKAIPYFAWSNREVGEMLVWINCFN